VNLAYSRGHSCCPGVPNINGVLARVFVPDLDAAIPLYQELAQVTAVNRFSFGEVELARVGPFLLLAGDTAAYRDRVATILVRELAPVIAALEDAGGQIIDGPSPAPNGDRLIAQHPDGSVFEYIQVAAAQPPD
jgi:predicted enzyme related to lactoylglutathione lyase